MENNNILIKNILLSISSGSWIGWALLKTVSVFCSVILPITGVVSFMLFLVINFKRIIDGFKDIKNVFK